MRTLSRELVFVAGRPLRPTRLRRERGSVVVVGPLLPSNHADHTLHLLLLSFWLACRRRCGQRASCQRSGCPMRTPSAGDDWWLAATRSFGIGPGSRTSTALLRRWCSGKQADFVRRGGST